MNRASHLVTYGFRPDQLAGDHAADTAWMRPFAEARAAKADDEAEGPHNKAASGWGGAELATDNAPVAVTAVGRIATATTPPFIERLTAKAREAETLGEAVVGLTNEYEDFLFEELERQDKRSSDPEDPLFDPVYAALDPTPAERPKIQCDWELYCAYMDIPLPPK